MSERKEGVSELRVILESLRWRVDTAQDNADLLRDYEMAWSALRRGNLLVVRVCIDDIRDVFKARHSVAAARAACI